MIIVKALLLQAIWFLVILYGGNVNSLIVFIFCIIFLLADYYFFHPKLKLLKFIFLAFTFLVYGFLNDFLLMKFNIVSHKGYSYNYLFLWPIFITYYDVLFKPLNKFSLLMKFFIGAWGGSFAYVSSVKLGAIGILPDQFYNLIIFISISWGVFLPLSLWLYNVKSIKDYILDRLVFTSFDSTGFRRHQKGFSDLPFFTRDNIGIDLSSKRAIVTGGTSGIGKSVLSSLSLLGIAVDFLGRNKLKGESLQKDMLKSCFIPLDMSDWESIEVYAATAEGFYDYVIFNAGGMPQEKLLNEKGVELQCASQLIGHYLLMSELRKNSKISEKTRIVWVSSGGMYLKKIDLSNLINPTCYDKVETYANVKRAQVTLVEELVKSDFWSSYQNFSMHPGWVGTNGLSEALPKFFNFFKNRLRIPSEGADTILWILLTQSNTLVKGGFYFDRVKVDPYFFRSFSPVAQDRKRMIEILGSYLE